MIYWLAILFSLIASFQSFASEITASNITHLKNGRQPNAGAAIFPTIPVFQILAVGAAWLLGRFVEPYAIWILCGGFAVFTIFWIFSFVRMKAELKRSWNL